VEGPDERDGVGDLERLQMALDGGARDAEGGSRPGSLELPAALPEHVFEKRVEAAHVAETEQTLDVTREEGVHPLAVQRRRLGVGEQRRWQAAVEQTLGERDPEGVQLAPQHRHEVHLSLPTCEGVAEFLAGGERGGPGGQNSDPRKHVGPDLEHAAGVAQLVDFVEDDDGLVAVAVEERRVAHHVLGNRQVAIDVESPFLAEATRQGGLPGAPYPGQPGDRGLLPGGFDTAEPERTIDHHEA